MTNIPPPESGPFTSPPPPPEVRPATPVPPAAGPFAPKPCASAPRRRSRWAIILGILLVLSIGVNAVMLAAVAVMGGMISGTELEESWVEKVVEKGPASTKIAVIRVDGVIDEAMAQSVHAQLQRAARDSTVKAVIMRINSPGGGLTASDMIHHDITSLLSNNKPVITSMDSLAASGGYYVACATDHIIAQETTITGSIGVIAQFFFLNGLLQDKLGVNTVTLKCGAQKDTPNMFAAGMTPEQQTYLQTSLLDPGFARFKEIVAAGRKMDAQKVDKLATGRIFMAKEAKENGLVDEIGYFDRAIQVAKDKAKIKSARIVEYVQPFRLADLLGVETGAKSRSIFNMTPERMAELASPKVMYLWTGY